MLSLSQGPSGSAPSPIPAGIQLRVRWPVKVLLGSAAKPGLLKGSVGVQQGETPGQLPAGSLLGGPFPLPRVLLSTPQSSSEPWGCISSTTGVEGSESPCRWLGAPTLGGGAVAAAIGHNPDWATVVCFPLCCLGRGSSSRFASSGLTPCQSG